MKLSKLNINGFNDDGFHAHVAATLPPLVLWLPASMKMLDPAFYIGSKSSKYVRLKVPDMDIKLNLPFDLDMGIEISFVDTDGLGEYIKEVANDPDKPELVISSDLRVKILVSVCI